VLIELDHLRKSFGNVLVLGDVTLGVPPGEIVALLGANGAGKTTLLRALAGVVAPDGGGILYDGEPFDRGRMDLRRKLVFLPDFPFAFGHLDAVRHIGMTMRLYERPIENREEHIVEILRNLDLLPLAATPMQNLSRGQYYKVCLAGLLAVDPDLWLLDEPLASGMDAHGIAYFTPAARHAAARGATVLYSTQILDVAETFSSRVCVIERGRIAFYDAVETLTNGDRKGALEALFQELRDRT
jgi:ABC-type multidrug transport system ATPase subunit